MIMIAAATIDTTAAVRDLLASLPTLNVITKPTKTSMDMLAAIVERKVFLTLEIQESA
jgi:hypothetical protein